MFDEEKNTNDFDDQLGNEGKKESFVMYVCIYVYVYAMISVG